MMHEIKNILDKQQLGQAGQLAAIQKLLAARLPGAAHHDAQRAGPQRTRRAPKNRAHLHCDTHHAPRPGESAPAKAGDEHKWQEVVEDKARMIEMHAF